MRTIYVKSEKQFYLYLDDEFIGTASTAKDKNFANCSTVLYPNIAVGTKGTKGSITYIDNLAFYASPSRAIKR